MAGWVLWLLATCAFAIGEMLTTGLRMASLALGSVTAAIADLLGAGGVASAAVFVLVSLLAFGMLRPAVLSRSRGAAPIRAGAGGLIGRQAVVLERIANHEGVGCVKIDGEIWTARAFDDRRVIERGAQVEVVEMKGATALVTE